MSGSSKSFYIFEAGLECAMTLGSFTEKKRASTINTSGLGVKVTCDRQILPLDFIWDWTGDERKLQDNAVEEVNSVTWIDLF